MDFFSKCNMVIRSEMDFLKNGIDIKLPFHFHIKDIKNTFLDKIDENELEIYGNEIYFQNKNEKTIEEYKQYLQYVDLKNLTIEDREENNEIFELTVKYREFRIFKDIDSLYYFLTYYLGFNEIDFQRVKTFILTQQAKLVTRFVDMLHKEMDIGSDKEDPTESFMVLRCAYELNHSATVFPENSGKSISEYSFRELRTQRVYMSRKCEIEKIQYDKVMKNNKNNRGMG